MHVQDGSLSIWRRTQGQLTYSLLGMHKLVPPPSRVNNNATLSLLCAAAAAWVRCDADALRSSDSASVAGGAFDPLDSLPPNSLGATTRALMTRGRKLSTIYSRVSAFSGSSTLTSESQVCAHSLKPCH